MAASSNATRIDLENPRPQGGRALYHPETQLERLLESPAAEERNWEKCSICRVPPQLQDQDNEKLYRPTLVSIGPYHHGQSHLMPMEEHKIRALAKSLKRTGKIVNDLKREFMEVDVSALMESYEDLDASEWSDRGKFLELLIIDGNFVLEFLRSFISPGKFYNNCDPVFGNYRLSYNKTLYLDIFKLENQVPFLVLEKLHGVLADSIQTTATTTTLVEYLDRGILLYDLPLISEKYNRESRKPMHLLDFLRTKMIGKLSTRTFPRLTALIAQSASTYAEAGIAFKQSNTTIISELKLDIENVLFLPLHLLEFEETLRANLQVYETLYSLGDLEIHSYFSFMKFLFQSVADIQLLVDSSAVASVRRLVGSPAVAEKVLNSFKHIRDGMGFCVHAESSVVTVVEQLNERRRESRKKWRRRLREWGFYFKQTYFSNPWKVLSLVGGLLLLGLTFSQTLYTALPYYHSH